MSRRRWGLLAAVLCLGVVVIAGSQCRGADRPGSTAPDSSSAHADNPSPAPVEPSATAVEPPAAVADREGTASDSADNNGTFARVAGRYEQNDLRLIAEVQRVTGEQPPPSIKQLIAMRRNNDADEATLRAHIDTEVDGLKLKVAARRWLDRELGTATAPTHPPGTGAPAVPAPSKRAPKRDNP